MDKLLLSPNLTIYVAQGKPKEVCKLILSVALEPLFPPKTIRQHLSRVIKSRLES